MGRVYARGNGKRDRCERRQFRDETIASYKGWAVVAAAVFVVVLVADVEAGEKKGSSA